MKNKLIVFDCFGVIFSDVADRWLLKHFSEEESERIHMGIISDADAGRITGEQMYKEVAGLAGVPVDVLKKEWLEAAVINREMTDYAKELRRYNTVILLSNAFSEFIDRVFERDSIEGCFERKFISSDLKMIKPDPAIFNYVLKEMGFSPEDSVMIDDNPKNIAAAKSIGMNGIVFCNREKLIKELEQLFK